ncbi:LysR family transcriptional regulator [Vibrio sp. EA2]|uniref:LysR family transcriptional regulator n=1 Tax=Vibrio sp. EA2 TaxID=3079860 RepID=UPI00294A44E9|nr:LysR family transcriptional regulator [Vibrio sp. EA2]MDV6253999.1 LysR family transcriptional regulator [Vibrio sp. EA2]
MINKSSIPSLKAMMAFESTVRLSSMTAAARELGISQPLVSQRIRSLEEDLGLILVDRTIKPVQATQVGRQFYGQISVSITAIKTAISQVRQSSSQQYPRVRIAAPFGFMFFWILPKLQNLQNEFRDIEFDIQPWVKTVNEKKQDSDIVFYFGKSEKIYGYEKQLVPEIVQPICSKKFAEEHGLYAGKYLYSIDNYPLLHMDTNNASWFDWNDWTRILSIKNKKESTTFYHNNYPLLVDDIKSGKGIGLGWVGLIEPLIKDGLIIPLEPKIQCCARGYHICTDYHHTRLIRTLVDWFELQADTEFSKYLVS